MCSTFKAFGSVGLVTSGTGRDVDQVRAIKYPVFAKGVCCSHAYCHILHIGLPVHVGGLTVNNGDLLHGDANGVARIPIEIAADVADVAADFADAERIILDYVQPAGPKDAVELARRRKDFTAAVTTLTERVRRKHT
jgi:regulator of RNase E activity RraA